MPKYGWKANSDYMWETEYNIQQVQARVHFLTSGCGCATKAFEAKQCGGNKSHLKCGPGLCNSRAITQPWSLSRSWVDNDQSWVGGPRKGNVNVIYIDTSLKPIFTIGCRCTKTGCKSIHNVQGYCKGESM